MFAFLLIQTDLRLLKNDFFFSHNRGSAGIKDKWERQLEQFENSERKKKAICTLHFAITNA